MSISVSTELVAAPHAWSGAGVLGAGEHVADRAAERAAAIDQLPGTGEQDPFQRLAVAFLVGYPRHSARAYLADLKAWGAWCTTGGVHPFDARRHHLDAWVRVLTTQPLARTGRPMAPSSIARRLSAVSAFYDYGIGVGVLGFSPVANARRPKVGEDSTTVGLTAGELVALLDAADDHSPRFGALVALLTYNGLRIDEALGADVTDYTHQRGHRVLRITRKGGRTASEPLAPADRPRSRHLPRAQPPTDRAAVPQPNRQHPTRVHDRSRADPPPRPHSTHPGCRVHHAALATAHLRHRSPRRRRALARRPRRRRPPRPPHHQTLRPQPTQPRPPPHLRTRRPSTTRPTNRDEGLSDVAQTNSVRSRLAGPAPPESRRYFSAAVASCRCYVVTYLRASARLPDDVVRPV